MPIPIDPRNKPAAVRIHVTTGAGVDISWADGHASHYDFPYLRELCPCATCNDEREKRLVFAAAGPASTSAAALPMFKPKPTAKAATSVGNYAIQITFSDGHATGIYSYDQLRTICPCPRRSTNSRSSR
jgi:prepilin-type processing-associated H-X9-DG protein